MLYFQDRREPDVMLFVSANKMAREVWEWQTLGMCQMLTRKISCYCSIFVWIRNFSDTKKQIPVFQMMMQQASKQLAVLMVCAVFRHIWQNCEEQLLASFCLCVQQSAWNNSAISFIVSLCPAVCMEQLSSHWTYFHEIWYLGNLWDVEKYGRARQVTDDKLIWCMCFVCWIRRLHTHTHNVQYLWLFHSNNGYADVPHCYIICTLPVLLDLLSFATFCLHALCHQWKACL